jgi:hypothetical protein
VVGRHQVHRPPPPAPNGPFLNPREAPHRYLCHKISASEAQQLINNYVDFLDAVTNLGIAYARIVASTKS